MTDEAGITLTPSGGVHGTYVAYLKALEEVARRARNVLSDMFVDVESMADNELTAPECDLRSALRELEQVKPTSASRLARTLANFLEVCEAARAVVAEVALLLQPGQPWLSASMVTSSLPLALKISTEEAPNPSVHIGTVDYLTGLPIAALAAALENLEGTE